MSNPHELLAGRYRLLRRIGAGGMGVVWEARDELLERAVAVKQLRVPVEASEADADLAKRRAMREARITARLHHPHAVPVFDAVEESGEPVLVMQYVPSRPLSAIMKERGALPAGEVARIGAQVAAALAAAHALRIVHRDVKPGNILITEDDGAAMLSDFGISHAMGDATLTSTGMMHGTPAYLAPEVARGDDSTFASDVFSLGSTLYAASEGHAPFGETPNSIAVLHRVALGGFPAPQHSGPLGALLLQMMADDPAARPTMRTVALRLAELEAELGGTEAPTLPLLTSLDEETAPIDLGGATAVLPEEAAQAAPAAAAPIGPEPEPEPDDEADAETIEEPATEEPATGEPPTEQPADKEPVDEQPVIEEPTAEEPATEEPVTEDPATEEPATEEPAEDEARSEAEERRTGAVAGAGAAAAAGALGVAVAPPAARADPLTEAPSVERAPRAVPPATTSPVAPPPVADPPDGRGTTRSDVEHRGRRRFPVAGVIAAVVVLLLLGLGLLLALMPRDGAAGPRAAGGASGGATSAPRSTAAAIPTASATPTPTPTATSTPTPRATATSTPSRGTGGGGGGGGGAALTPANLRSAISHYYGLVPRNTDAAWPLMTAAYQTNHAGGRAAFQRFWDPVADVTASNVRATGSDSVQATLRYAYKDGHVVTEVTGFRLVPQGGVLKIADSTVISHTG